MNPRSGSRFFKIPSPFNAPEGMSQENEMIGVIIRPNECDDEQMTTILFDKETPLDKEIPGKVIATIYSGGMSVNNAENKDDIIATIHAYHERFNSDPMIRCQECEQFVSFNAFTVHGEKAVTCWMCIWDILRAEQEMFFKRLEKSRRR